MDKKKVSSIIVLVIGIITLVVGVVFLVLHFMKGPAVSDGDYLVSKDEWVLDDDKDCAESEEAKDCVSGVIWKFTEIGRGSLTTNNHTNDYDFKWALKDGKIIVQTNWLYELDDEYDYKLDQGAGVLTLTNSDNQYKFVAKDK